MSSTKTYILQTLFLIIEIVFFVGLLLLAIAGYFLFIYPLWNEMELSSADIDLMFEENPLEMLLINFIPISLISLLVMWLVHVVIFKRDEALLGFRRSGLVPEFTLGWLWGFVLIFFGFLLLVIADQIDVIGFKLEYDLLLGFLLMFLIQSFSEEILMRSYLIPTIERRLGTWAALIITSVGFMAMHLGNTGIAVIGCLDLLLGGILMGLLFIKFRNIWAPTGFHVAWNYFQSTIFGFEVSGVKTYSWFLLDEKGYDIFTGGEFGFEGSIFSVLFLALSIVFLWQRSPDLIHQFTVPTQTVADEDRDDHF